MRQTRHDRKVTQMGVGEGEGEVDTGIIAYEVLEEAGGTLPQNELVRRARLKLNEAGQGATLAHVRRAINDAPYLVTGLVYRDGRRGAAGRYVATWSHVTRVASVACPCSEAKLRRAFNDALLPAREVFDQLDRLPEFKFELRDGVPTWLHGDDEGETVEASEPVTGWFEVGPDGEEVWVDG